MPGEVSRSLELDAGFRDRWLSHHLKEGYKFFVLKAEDFLPQLDDWEAALFNEWLERVEKARRDAGKSPFNNYWICNRDEPFADEVRAVLEKHIGPLKPAASPTTQD